MTGKDPTPTDGVIALDHVTLRYDSGTQALEDVTLVVREGERLCVLGANGSGKSTLASVACGLLAPDTGSVRLLGERVFDASGDAAIDFAAYQRARRGLGLVFQNPDDQIVTTVVEEDVAFGPENLGVPPAEIGRRVERELRRVAMDAYAKADPTRLSGGQKQRVAIAGALAMEPRVLVFDEPGSLLDVRGRLAIMRVMSRLHDDGTTIVHITHFMEEALAADRVIVMDHGRIVLEGTPDQVFAGGERLVALGLEEPFVARLAARLRERGVDVPWTCDERQLEDAVTRLALAAGAEDATGAVPAPTDARETNAQPINDQAATSEAPAILAQDVCFAYRHERKALDGVSFSLAQETSGVLVGQTGSGKSTLLRLLCALEVPDAGRVVISGVDTKRKRGRRRLHGTIGYVMQHPERQLFAETVIKDVAFGPTNMGLSAQEVKRRCTHALELVGLLDLADASPFELSGGQQRLCAIAGILAMEPSIIVLDEPIAGLDPRGRRELRAILEDIQAHGVTVLQVTHSMEDAVRAERVIVLNEAHVMMTGTPSEVFSPRNRDALEGAGLGLPTPLLWALRLEARGLPPLGDPLTLGELAASLARQLTAREVC